MMFDRDAGKNAAKVVRTLLKLELDSDPGRLNLVGTALTFLLIVLLGMPSVLEATLSHLLPGGANYEFPWIPVIGLFIGGWFACVALLVIARPFLEGAESEGDDRK